MIATFGLGILVATVSWPTLLLVASGVGLVVAVAFNVSQQSAALRLHTIQSALAVEEAAGSEENAEEAISSNLQPSAGRTQSTSSSVAVLLRSRMSYYFWTIYTRLTKLGPLESY